MKDHLNITWINTDWSVLSHDLNQSVSIKPAGDEQPSAPDGSRHQAGTHVLSGSGPSRTPHKDLQDLDAVLQRARRDAEALAWTTPFPRLVLPGLLEEKKSEALGYWRRQHSIREHSARLWAHVDPVPVLLAA
jgi:hypothetical protein